MTGVYAGTKIRISGVFADTSGTATDPTAVALTVHRSDGTVDTLSTTKDSTGHYHGDYDTTGKAAGVYRYRWAGTGALIAAGEDFFEVVASGVS